MVSPSQRSTRSFHGPTPGAIAVGAQQAVLAEGAQGVGVPTGQREVTQSGRVLDQPGPQDLVGPEHVVHGQVLDRAAGSGGIEQLEDPVGVTDPDGLGQLADLWPNRCEVLSRTTGPLSP